MIKSNLVKSKILITGASGAIGKNLVRKKDFILVRKSIGFENEIIGDLTDLNSLIRACKNIDIIYHCAGFRFAEKKSILHHEINFLGTKNLLTAAKLNSVKKIIFLSSIKVMDELKGDQKSHYALSKKKAEELLLSFGIKNKINVTILRLPMVYGMNINSNLNTMITGIKIGWFFPLPETGNKRALIYIDDVVSAIRCVSKSKKANGKIYVINDGNQYSGRQIYNNICQAIGKDVPNWHVPKTILEIVAVFGSLIENIFGIKMKINKSILSKLLGSSWYSANLIEKELKWKPKISLQKGLKLIIK